MTAKEFLLQIRKIDILIQNKQETLEVLQAKVGIQGIGFENDGSSSPSRNVNKNEEMIIKIVMLKDEINQQIDNLIDKKHEVMKVIDSLDDPDEINLLYLRYFKYMTWEKIAVKMNYSYKWVHEIHGKALKSVDERIHSSTQNDVL